jgi:hypothetical protein
MTRTYRQISLRHARFRSSPVAVVLLRLCTVVIMFFLDVDDDDDDDDKQGRMNTSRHIDVGRRTVFINLLASETHDVDSNVRRLASLNLQSFVTNELVDRCSQSNHRRKRKRKERKINNIPSTFHTDRSITNIVDVNRRIAYVILR